MKLMQILFPIRLDLFDGGAAAGSGAAGGEGGTAAAAGTPGDGNAQAGMKLSKPSNGRRGSKAGELSNVIYGKPPQDIAAAAGDMSSDAGSKTKNTETIATSNTLEEKRAKFKQLVSKGGEFYDIYTNEVQGIIDRRFKEYKTLQETLAKHQPILDALFTKYGISDGNLDKLINAIEKDDALYNEAAERAGLTVEQFKYMQRLQRENAEKARLLEQINRQQEAQRQLADWIRQAEEMRADYPDFDLMAEQENPEFIKLLKAGIPVRKAYEVLHMDEIVSGKIKQTAQETEKKVVDHIRAKGARPAENAVSFSQGSFIIKSDPSKFTKADRAEIARRVERGEKIEL